MKKRDRALGMDREITRRDFLNGMQVAVAGSLLTTPAARAFGAFQLRAAQDQPGYYPPTLTGMRGSHDGSFEVAHAIRDGKRWDDASDTGEEYDLVVVGGGLSGLAAAWFYRKEAGPNARILILENHDDFGGHAKRNEFRYKGRSLVDIGGAEYIEAPWRYPESAKTLLADVGIDTSRAEEVFDHGLYEKLNLRGGVFFDEKTFGENKLVAGAPGIAPPQHHLSYVTLPAELERGIGDPAAVRSFLATTPLSGKARDTIFDLFCGDRDYLSDKSAEEKLSLLKEISYQEFLMEVVGAEKEVVDFFWMWRGSYMGNGLDITPALAAMRYGLPGSRPLGLKHNMERPWHSAEHSYKDELHFPDGNASIARSIVRRLVPDVAPGSSMHDICAAEFDYTTLDKPASATRIRLNATAIDVRHAGNDKVHVSYVRDGRALRVSGKYCVLACYHAIIPSICSELPDPQQKALRQTIRMPLVSTNVLLDNWTAFEKAGVFAAYCPGSYFCDVRLTYPVQFSDYAASKSPAEPTTIKLYRIPLPGGMPPVDQFRAGRLELLSTPFSDMERQIRQQLTDMFSEYGFDASRDIKGIIVNRWPHGYAVGYDYESGKMNYWSDQWPDNKRLWLTGRKAFGRIAIANSDAAASAMSESAIDQGYRATRELLETT